LKRPRLSGIPGTFLFIPSAKKLALSDVEWVEESLAVFRAILTETESEMFREACPEQSRRPQHDNAIDVQAGLIPRNE
jgi:hypothetical protein